MRVERVTSSASHWERVPSVSLRTSYQNRVKLCTIVMQKFLRGGRPFGGCTRKSYMPPLQTSLLCGSSSRIANGD